MINREMITEHLADKWLIYALLIVLGGGGSLVDSKTTEEIRNVGKKIDKQNDKLSILSKDVGVLEERIESLKKNDDSLGDAQKRMWMLLLERNAESK